LLVRAVLNTINASGEGDEGNKSADGEHEECDIAQSWGIATDQDTANPLVIQPGENVETRANNR